MVRLGGALCVAMAAFAYSSSSMSIIKTGGIARGAVISRSMLLRKARERMTEERTEKASHAAIKVAAAVNLPNVGTGPASATGIGAVIARALSAGATITGVASTYNPFRPDDSTAGGKETASGERYDPGAWTAAIQTDLRNLFGGVHYGKDYVPCYALVAADDKQAIIKINDVGPLEPGRVIDLNEQTMRYFDPTFELGLISHITVTPLRGDGWLTGPLPQRGSSAS
ncbi:MAG TPA: septal ring lytic transglycosylase RlpA family protein [Xanthobacteraceae bacterium]|nr:septal ring lytic transglycosylase RlpA family protein [Xanthobacteraceae bacterium]